jgi:hypothetical protein
MEVRFEELLGKTIINIGQFDSNGDTLQFETSDGAIYQQYHNQDCCEYVYIEDINGDLNDLIGYPILQAEESTQDASGSKNVSESGTWTFYKLATIKGYVTIRWLGESNGYYSEGVDFYKIREEYPIKELRMKKLNKINKNE